MGSMLIVKARLDAIFGFVRFGNLIVSHSFTYIFLDDQFTLAKYSKVVEARNSMIILLDNV